VDPCAVEAPRPKRSRAPFRSRRSSAIRSLVVAGVLSDTEIRILKALAWEDDYYLSELGTPVDTRAAWKRLVRDGYVELYAVDWPETGRRTLGSEEALGVLDADEAWHVPSKPGATMLWATPTPKGTAAVQAFANPS
jgi:hypothetical protein